MFNALFGFYRIVFLPLWRGDETDESTALFYSAQKKPVTTTTGISKIMMGLVLMVILAWFPRPLILPLVHSLVEYLKGYLMIPRLMHGHHQNIEIFTF